MNVNVNVNVEVLEAGGAALMDSLECLATERCAVDSLLARFNPGVESLSPSSVRDAAVTTSSSPAAASQPGVGGVSSDKLRKRTYRIGLNLFNK